MLQGGGVDFTEIDREDFRNQLGQLAGYHMPFGQFGPKSYPPKGVPLTDLPEEYLAWFAARSWPKGKLGELMQLVWDIKSHGADFVFEPIRKARGGRMSVRKAKPKTDFSEE